MSLRHSLLAAGGLAVVAAGIYLAIEVRSTANASAKSVAPVATAADSDEKPRRADPAGDSSSSETATAKQPGKRSPTVERDPAKSDSSPGSAPAVPAAGADKLEGEKLEIVVKEAYDAYDRQEFEDAKSAAGRVLLSDPKHTRALRIMVSTACIDGNQAEAQKYFDQLPPGSQDRADMKKRCARDYNITFQ